MTTEPTEEQFDLAIELVRVSERNKQLLSDIERLIWERDRWQTLWLAGDGENVAAMRRERDGLAAVIANALDAGKFVIGRSMMRSLDAMILALRAAPAEARAARDAEKWAEGHGTGVNYAQAMEREGVEAANEFAITANPYRTPAQPQEDHEPEAVSATGRADARVYCKHCGRTLYVPDDATNREFRWAHVPRPVDLHTLELANDDASRSSPGVPLIDESALQRPRATVKAPVPCTQCGGVWHHKPNCPTER